MPIPTYPLLKIVIAGLTVVVPDPIYILPAVLVPIHISPLADPNIKLFVAVDIPTKPFIVGLVIVLNNLIDGLVP